MIVNSKTLHLIMCDGGLKNLDDRITTTRTAGSCLGTGFFTFKPVVFCLHSNDNLNASIGLDEASCAGADVLAGMSHRAEREHLVVVPQPGIRGYYKVPFGR